MDNEKLVFMIGGDASELDKTFNEIGKSFDKIKARAIKVNAEISASTRSTGLGWSKGVTNQMLSGMGIDTNNFLGDIGKRNKVLNAMKPEIMAFKQSIASLQDTTVFQKMTSGLNLQGKALDNVALKAATYNRTWTASIDHMNKLSSSLWVTSMGMKQLGTGLTMGLTLPLGVAGYAVAKFSSDFDAAMSQIQASAGAGLTFKSSLGEDLKVISMNMPETIKNLQDYAYAATQAGVADQAIGDENKSKAIAKYTITMAELAGIEKDYKGTAKDLADMMGKVSYAYGLTANDAEKVGSALRFASKNIVGGLSDISSALARSAGPAGIFGITLEQTLGVLMTILPALPQASRAGTQLGNIFQYMAVNVEKYAKTMGVSSEQAKKAINENMIGALQDYAEALSQVNDAQKSDVIKNVTDMFGIDTAKVFEALILHIGDLPDAIAGVSDAYAKGILLQQDYATATDNVASKFQILKNTAQVLMIDIGQDLAGAFQAMIDVATKASIIMMALWDKLPDAVKKVGAAIALVLALMGPLVLVSKLMFVDIIAGLVTVIAKTGQLAITRGIVAAKSIAAAVAETANAAAITAEATAASVATPALTSAAAATTTLSVASVGLLPYLGYLAIGIGVLVAALGLLYAAYKNNIGGLKDFASGVTNKFNELKSSVDIKGIMDKASEEASASLDNVGGGSAAKMVKIAGGWGSKIIEAYTRRFSEIDMDVFKKGTDILQQVFDEQEKLGQISGEQMYSLGKIGRELLAKAIMDAKKLGNVSSETKSKLIELVGSSRVGSIIESIKAAIKVDKLQDALDKYKEKLEQLQEKSESVIKALDKKINAQEKLDKAEEKLYSDRIKALNKQIKLSEKQQEEEVDVYEDKLKIDKATLDTAKATLKLKENTDKAIIDTMKDEKDAEQRNLDSAKKQLTALEKLRDKYLTIAEGLVTYNKNNLSAAEREVELQRAYGKDEFDASYRLAKQKAKTANEQVTLAEQQQAIVERAGSASNDSIENASMALKDYVENQAVNINQQIALYTKEIDNLETAIDALQDNIDIKQSLYDKEEAILQTMVDNAQTVVDADNTAIDSINEKWLAIIEPLEELVDTEQDNLSDIQDAHQAYLDTLNEEKDALQEKYDAEIDIEQAKVDNAQKSLNAAKDSLDTINKINAELLAAEAERIGKESYSPATGGGGTISGASSDGKYVKITPEQQAQIDAENASGSAEDRMANVPEDMRTLIESYNKQMDDLKAKYASFKPFFIASWNDTWEQITQGYSSWRIGFETMYRGQLEVMDGSTKAWNGLFSGEWGLMWEGIKEMFKGYWDEIVGILDIVFGWLVDLFVFFCKKFYNTTINLWEDVKIATTNAWNRLREYISGKCSEIYDDVSSIWNNIKTTVANVASNLWNSAKGGFDTMKTNVKKWVSDMLDVWKDAKDWGSHLMENFAEGVKNSINKVKEEIDNVKEWIKDKLGFSYNKYMPTETWGKHMIENYAKGIESTLPLLTEAFESLQDITRNGLNVPIVNTGALASSSLAASELGNSKKNSSNTVTQNSGNTYNIQPGTMIASQGEIREFVRLLNKYQATEAARNL